MRPNPVFVTIGSSGEWKSFPEVGEDEVVWAMLSLDVKAGKNSGSVKSYAQLPSTSTRSASPRAGARLAPPDAAKL